jgi:hypothetical protein
MIVMGILHAHTLNYQTHSICKKHEVHKFIGKVVSNNVWVFIKTVMFGFKVFNQKEDPPILGLVDIFKK